MKKIWMLPIIMLLMMLTTALACASYDDDCPECQEKTIEQNTYNILYCKILDIRESDRYNKITLEVETGSYTIRDPLTVVFYNVTDDIVNRLYDFQDSEAHSSRPWVTIFYTVDNIGQCHPLLVEKALKAPDELPVNPPAFFLLILGWFILFLIVFVFVMR